jgi:hypothetical protein
MKKTHNMNLLFKMILMFILIFTAIWLFATYKILPLATDSGAALASCLSAGATIFAAIVAYLLLDNWKIQHKYQLTSTYFQKTFNSYVELNESLFRLQNHYDSWSEEIYREHGEIDDYEDGGLISKIGITRDKLKNFVDRIEAYSLIFKDDGLNTLISEVDSKLKKILCPVMDEYHAMEGQIDSRAHLRNSESLKKELTKFLVDYDKKIKEQLASKIVF